MQYLFKKEHTFYYKRRIPNQNIIYTQSLKTGTKEIAKQRANTISFIIENHIERIVMSSELIVQLVQNYLNEALAPENEDGEMAHNRSDSYAEEIDGQMMDGDHPKIVKKTKKFLSNAIFNDTDRDKATEIILQHSNIPKEEIEKLEGIDLKNFKNRLIKAEIEILSKDANRTKERLKKANNAKFESENKLTEDHYTSKEIMQILTDDTIDSQKAKMFRIYQDAVLRQRKTQQVQITESVQNKESEVFNNKKIPRKVTLEETVNRFIKIKEDEELYDMLRKYKSLIKNELYVFLDKDKDIGYISDLELEELYEAFKRLPKRYTENKKYKNIPIKELIKMDIPDADKQSSSTLEGKTKCVRAIFNFAIEKNYIKENYMKIYRAPKKNDDEDAGNSRCPYDNEDLQKIFSSNLFTKDLIKTIRTNPSKIFVPLIAMFSGMRVNEICQSYVEDIREENGVMVFDINRKLDKKLKNKQSKRTIPIHSTIIDAGFLHYIDYLKKHNKERVWEELKFAENKYSKGFVESYRKFNRTYITEDPGKVFHSFRHGVTTQLDNICNKERISEAVSYSLLGHLINKEMYQKLISQNDSHSNYFHGFNIDLKKTVVDQIEYDIDINEFITNCRNIVENIYK